MKTFATSNGEVADESDEIRRLKRPQARVTEERDIIKSAVYFATMRSEVGVIALHRLQFSMRTTCGLFRDHLSGFMHG